MNCMGVEEDMLFVAYGICATYNTRSPPFNMPMYKFLGVKNRCDLVGLNILKAFHMKYPTMHGMYGPDMFIHLLGIRSVSTLLTVSNLNIVRALLFFFLFLFVLNTEIIVPKSSSIMLCDKVWKKGVTDIVVYKIVLQKKPHEWHVCVYFL